MASKPKFALHLFPLTSNLSLTVALTIHLLFPIHTLSEVCESTCDPREWKHTCDADCEECPKGGADDPYPIIQRDDWRSVFEGGDTVGCGYTTQLYSQGAGKHTARVEAFNFTMASSVIDDTCITSELDVSVGTWPDNVTESDLNCDVHDASCVCVRRCQQVCSQYPECSMADYNPATHHCRLFKQGAPVIGSTYATAIVLSRKMSQDCVTKDGHHLTTRPQTVLTTTTTVTTTVCATCARQFWKPSCVDSCRSCPAVDQDADDVPQAMVDNNNIPTVPITCDFQLIHGLTADDDGDRSNRVEVFSHTMIGGDVCLIADMNIDIGGWPSRVPTHRERCMELCAQHPLCGVADLNAITHVCRLYQCSAKRTRSTTGHVLLVKRAGTCKDLPEDVDDGGGCTFETSDTPTNLPTLPPQTSSPTSSSPSQIPTSIPTALPTRLPTFLPSVLPTPHPSHHPSPDPCCIYTCVLDCGGACGWDADTMLCESGKTTTQLERDSLAGCTSSSSTLDPSSNTIVSLSSSSITTSTVLTSVGIAVVIIIIVSVVSFVYVRTQFYQLEEESAVQGDFVEVAVENGAYEAAIVGGYDDNKSQISHM